MLVWRRVIALCWCVFCFVVFLAVVLWSFVFFVVVFFFFSSRRRHTRCLSDWSSDVCSSDLSLRSAFTALETSASDALYAQGVTADRIRIERKLAIKYAGTDSTLQLSPGEGDRKSVV